MPSSGTPLIGPYGLPASATSYLPESCSSSPAPTLPSTMSTSSSTSTSEQSFTDPHAMPPPGVAHFQARRARWLTPPQGLEAREPSPSTSRAKLEALLASEDAISNDNIWNAGIRDVWKGLVGGGRLRRRLPLGMVLKILQAGWLRDGTWPADEAGMPLSVPQASSPGPIRPPMSPLEGYVDNRENDPMKVD